MPSWLGIDVGRAAVKVAVLRSSYRKTTLVGLASADVVESGGPAEAIRRAVGAATGKIGVGDGAATSIEGSKVSTHVLSLPATVQRQLGEVVPFELEAQVPFDLSDAVFDHRVLAGARAQAA